MTSLPSKRPSQTARRFDGRKHPPDAAALGVDSEDVVAVIQRLAYPGDFEKSATAHHDPRQWHDSYKPMVEGRRLYLKFTVDETGAFLLTSFKEA